MYRKNPNNVKCPIHGLHYDQSKQDGCALCLREEAMRAKPPQKDKKGLGLLLILAVSVVLGVITWAALRFGFPPPSAVQTTEEPATLTYDEPVGWNREDITGRTIALDRMGLHSPDSPWSIVDRFTYYSKNVNQNRFLEYIQVLKGPGAYRVDPKTLAPIQAKLKELKPSSVLEPVIVSSELTDVAGTQGVSFVVSYQSDDLRYQALVYYIPGGDHHYWVALAAQALEWERWEPIFQQFIGSLQGGRQGKEAGKRLPAILLSPYRSVWAGMAMFLFALWLITFIVFRKERQKLKKQANYRRDTDKRQRHIIKD